MDLMNTNPRNRAWTLPESNTGLCNIPTNNSPFFFPNDTNTYKKKHRKHKAKSHTRKSKRHQHITNKTVANDSKSMRKRSLSRPRLSQAKLFEIKDQEINVKRKRKQEFMVNRERRKERRQSLDLNMNTPPKKGQKRKKLCYIKEDTPSKPSTNKKSSTTKYLSKIPALLTQNPRKKRTKTLSATSINVRKKRKRNDNTLKSSNKPHSTGSRTPNIMHKRKKQSNKKSRQRSRFQSMEHATAQPKYKYRGRGRRHNHSSSYCTHLNTWNQSIKDQNTSDIASRPIYKKKKSLREKKKPNSCTMSKKHRKKRSTSDTLSPALQLCFASEEELEERHNAALTVPQSLCSSTSCGTDSDVGFVGFPPNGIRHGRGRSESNFEKPTVHIVYSPRVNEAVFIGYKSARPTYSFRGRGKLDAKIEDDMVHKSPPAQPTKFTFNNIKSEYKAHRIKWSTKTGFTDSEMDDEDMYPDNVAMLFFSDNNDSDSSECKDEDYEETMKARAHKRSKTVQINRLLANLLSDEDAEEEQLQYDDNKQFKIVIDEIQHDTKGNDIYIGSVTASDDECTSPSPTSKTKGSNVQLVFASPSPKDDGNELLFDIESFVNNLSKKRSQLKNNDDIEYN